MGGGSELILEGVASLMALTFLGGVPFGAFYLRSALNNFHRHSLSFH